MTQKYRAWIKKEKYMIPDLENAHIIIDKDGFTLSFGKGVTISKNNKVLFPEDFILLQSTGLKDKNGKEIFEGDIVKIIGRTGLFKVEFKDFGWALTHTTTPEWGLDMQRNAEWTYKLQFEVIGNIYENPELLKGGRK